MIVVGTIGGVHSDMSPNAGCSQWVDATLAQSPRARVYEGKFVSEALM